MLKNRFAELLGEKIGREKRHISIAEVARETGLAPRSIYPWQTNQIKRIDVVAIEALCKYFNCQPGDLLVYIPDPEPEKEQP